VLAAIIQAVVGAMSDMEGKFQDYCGKLDSLDQEIHEKFFGPINNAWNEKVRARGIDGLKSKYGPQFDEIQEPLSALGVPDVYGFLYDQLEALKKESGDGYNDDMGHEAVMAFHRGGLDRIGKIRGTPAEEPKAPEAEKPSIAGEVAAEKPEKPKTLKDKKGRMSMMGGY
jgi:hypothetical protein